MENDLRAELNKHADSYARETNVMQYSTNVSSGLPPLSKVSKIKDALQNDTKTVNKSRERVGQLEEECQKLRESYSAHRSRKRSTEVAFETRRRSPSQTDKENIQQINRFKRNQKVERSQASYQEKYSRLEQNFKRFTQSLQEKRSSSNSGRQRRDHTPEPDSPHSNFYMSREPTRKPLHAHHGAPIMDKSLNDREFQFNSIASEDMAFQVEGDSRVHMLNNLISQVNTFFQSSFGKLFTLCVSRQQEAQIKEIQTQVASVINEAQQCARQNLILDGGLEEECERIQEVFKTCIQTLEASFQQILSRVFEVESETFKNYKFKQVLVQFDAILQESQRLNLYQLLPQLVERLTTYRVQAGAHILHSYTKKRTQRDVRSKFAVWRTKIGMDRFLTLSLKQTLLTRAVLRVLNHKVRADKVRFFHFWKQLVMNRSSQFQQNDQSFFESLFLDKTRFNQCLQKDQGLALTISQQVRNFMGDHCDVLLLGEETSEEHEDPIAVVTSYDQKNDSSRKSALSAVAESSLTGQAFLTTDIVTHKAIFASSLFNEQIDQPQLSSEFEKKQFTDLNMMVVPLPNKGVLRVFSPNNFSEKDVALYKQIAPQLTSFIDRVQTLRWQLGCLTEELQVKQEQISVAELERFVHECLFDILQGIQSDSKQEFLDLIQTRASALVGSLVPGCFLRQVYHKKLDLNDPDVIHKVSVKALLEDKPQMSLVRRRDHAAEQQDILEDFLDYQADRLVHQISIDTPSFNFVFQRELEKISDYGGLKLTSNLRFAFSLFGRCLQPVINQGLTIHDDLANQVHLQARQLCRQVSLNATKDDLRDNLSNMPGLPEKEAFVVAMDTFFTTILESDLIQKPAVKINRFACLINSGLITGEPLQTSSLVAYLTPSQNELLEMPQELSSEITDEVGRFEAPVREFIQEKQEIQVKESINVSARLPLFSNRCLLAFMKIQMTLNSEDLDKQSTMTDIKALLNTVAIEGSKVLTEIVYAQSHQSFQFKECLEHLQTQVSSLTMNIDFMQALQYNLIIPFTESPSAKLLGNALTQLAAKILPTLETEAVSLVVDGKIVVDDLRSLEWTNIEDGFEVEQALTFNLVEKTISILIEGVQNRSLMLRLSLEANKSVDQSFVIQQCEDFQMIITPFVKAAMSSFSPSSLLSAKQEQLPRVLSKIVTQRKYGHIYNFFMNLRELQIKKVPIFTRLRSYQAILKKRYHEFGIDEQIGYGEEDKREHMVRSQILSMYTKSINKLNQVGQSMKRHYFLRLRDTVLEQMHFETRKLAALAKFVPTKMQRKAITQLAKISMRMQVRADFSKMAVQANQFRNINNPHTKFMAAACCLNFNCNRVRERLAFQRLRSNASGQMYRDFGGAEIKDREKMVQLNKLLLSTHLDHQDASHNLEESIMNVLEQALTYLQESLMPEQLDCLIVSVAQNNTKRARAYVFNNRLVNEGASMFDPVQVDQSEVIDGVMSQNMGLLIENLEGLTDFNISFKRDIILQMLQKSKTMFNFHDISSSLYNLYVTHLGQNQTESFDQQIAQRMMLVKKSRSSLIMPLLVPKADQMHLEEPELQLVGSLELYRFHQQKFDEEVERRIQVFSNLFARDVLPVYFQMRSQQAQIESLRKQVSRTAKNQTSLSALLRQVYFSAPKQLNASQILPIIIDQNTKTAFFYQFKDNHIYNFQYGSTFIGELVDNTCILELASNEPFMGEQQSELDDMSSSAQSYVSTSRLQMMEQNIQLYDRIPGHRKRNFDAGDIKSVTNEGFKHILYYPVMSGPFGKCKAVIEVCFSHIEQVPKKVLTEAVTTFLETFSHQLTHLESKVRSFIKFTGGIVEKKQSIRIAKAFQHWKARMVIENQKMVYIHEQKQQAEQTDNCFAEYVKSLESYDNELKRLVEERQQLSEELTQLRHDGQIQAQQMGAAVILMRTMERRSRRTKVKEFFNRWKMNQHVAKIAQTAFNKILELNHRHSNRRFASACYLLTKSLGSYIKRDAMDQIVCFAQMSQLKNKESTYKSSDGWAQYNALAHSGEYHFSNIVGPFTKSNLAQPNIVSSPLISSNRNDTPLLSGHQTPMPPPMTQSSPGKSSHIKQIESTMGFGAVPSSTRNRSQDKRRRSRDRSTSAKRFIR